MKNFTMIEPLVVVAILGILISILMPSLQNTREKDKLTVCKSNQKQIPIDYVFYSSKHNGFYPAVFESGSYTGLANFSFVDDHVKGINGKKFFDCQNTPGSTICYGTMFDHERED